MYKSILTCLMVFNICFCFGQTFKLSGYISNASNGESLIGATVWSQNAQKGTVTNNYGFFQLNLSGDEDIVSIRFVGYDTYRLKINLESDTIVNIGLRSNNLLNEVLVEGWQKREFLSAPAMSLYKIQAKDIEKIPAMLGEPDIMKAIQMLPGVSMTSEGKTSVSVRGGSPDQTLILLDGVPVYNVNHLFGFLSTFNTDAISSANIYKGGLPARYGGRLSSVVDIATKKGDFQHRTGVLSVGTMAGRFFLEGPLVREKVSYALALRRTWLDLPIQMSQIMNYAERISYGFWDINAKLNWRLGNRDRLFLSFYNGKDYFMHKDTGLQGWNSELDYRFNWRNQTALLRWNHIFNTSLFSNTSIYTSRYIQELKNILDKKTNSYQRSYNSLVDYTIKTDFFKDQKNLGNLKFGYQVSVKEFSPEVFESKNVDSVSIISADAYVNPVSVIVYIDQDLTISKLLKMNLGLRATDYMVSKLNYWSLEPRLTLSYLLNDNMTVKASYSRMKQFMHMLSNSTIGVSTDMWVSSTKKIKPGTSNLISAGLFYQKTDMYKLSAEIYYSEMKRVTKYKEGGQYFRKLGETWDNVVTIGTGQAYGLELFAEKKSGNFTAMASYSLSESNRKFSHLNNGNRFPYKYGRRH